MNSHNNSEQTDPVEKTMRRVVVGFIVISTAISFIYLWFDSRQMKGESTSESGSVQLELSTDK